MCRHLRWCKSLAALGAHQHNTLVVCGEGLQSPDEHIEALRLTLCSDTAQAVAARSSRTASRQRQSNLLHQPSGSLKLQVAVSLDLL